uniref:Uncharacterized protein n=1 Tax=Ditylenchus dipsaci TaxID=166011 RepID=A0A915DJD6_9BILA
MDKLLKKKKEEEEQQRLQEALEEFQQTFEDGSGKHVPKTFIRGDIVNANKSMGSLPSVYKPVPIQNKPLQTPQNIEKAKKIAEETARKIMHEASQNQNKIPPNRPPKPGAKKVVQSNRMTNLEIFKEELKQVQQMREERKGLRQQLQEKLGADNEAIDRIAPLLTIHT